MTDQPSGPEYVMTLSCPDAPGLVFAITGFLREYGANILDLQQHSDRSSGRFFIRLQVEFLGDAPGLAPMREAFASVAASYRMDYTISDAATPVRTLILVSKFGHCLNDLLFRHRNGTLNIDVPVVVSNHEDMRAMVESYGIAYEYIPVAKDTKTQAEAAMLALVERYDVELVVLARYMQILSAETSARLAGRAINIHHSFLPSFKGARPYHQAHDRGVKIIGATAHYVSDVLDEGPIIEQDVARADHGMTSEDLVAVGRDVETQVLARAVKWHCEHRIFLNGHRTVVFD